MSTTLQDFGVQANSLTDEEKAFLDEHGYVSLGRVLTDDQLQKIRERLQVLLEEEGERAGSELLDSPYIRHPKEVGADRTG